MGRTRSLAIWTLAINVGVIVLGALVRATGSGAGCGRNWPVCQGEILPSLEGATAVEFTHRAASGVALVAVAILVVWVFRASERGHPARIGAVLSGISIIVEALIGAVIVLAEWVADDTSVARSVSVPIHLVSTFVLLAGLTLTVFWLGGGGRLALRGRLVRHIALVGTGMLLVGGTGGITALADTLFPKEGFNTGAIFEGGEHFLTQLRVIHPLLAIAVGVVAAVWARWNALPAGGPAATAGRFVVGVVVAEMALGVFNVLLGTPVWLSLLHLGLADLLWIGWVWMGAELLAHQPIASISRE